MRLAYQDASLSHTANGIYGELWSAALLAEAFTATTVAEAFEASLAHVPPRSRLAEALHDVNGMRREGLTWDQALAGIQARYGRYSWVHTIPNAALIAAGLLWGENDYADTVGLTVMGGWDTDSNGATAGSVAGVVLGAAGLPRNFVAPCAIAPGRRCSDSTTPASPISRSGRPRWSAPGCRPGDVA